MFKIVQPQSGEMPFAGSNHSLIHHDNQLYLVGGGAGQGACHKIWKFNLLTNKWKLISKDYPPKILVDQRIQNAFPKAILFGNGLLIIYVRCGRGYMFPFSGSRKFEHVPLTWAGDMPQVAQPTLHAPAIIQCPDNSHRVYVFQPRSSGDGMDVVDVYTLTTTDLIGRWEKVDVTGECKYSTPNISEGFLGVAAVLYHRKVYICNAPACNSGDFRKLYAFNLDTLSWETVLTTHEDASSWPLSRHLHSVVLYNDIVYFVGGMTQNEHFFDSVLQLNLKTKKWNTKRNRYLSEHLALTSATVTQDGCVYVFGGYNFTRLYSNQLQRFWLQPQPFKWITFHKVKRMYDSSSKEQISKSDPQALLAMGIPPDFVTSLQE